ncbi:MAG: NusG domain II-containing protein [Candidatus Aminicenantes bacterium]|nr:NusG domain II-containing protein [Candidatus Aminicenantes bacterium]MDH5704882.1 NusG domain II-containing protein [Candidatus Aminicenantes bacterium]
MDRRDFFKTCIVVPLLTKFALSSETTNRTTGLYLIADSPRQFLPSILRELNALGLISGNTFTFLNPHPEEKEIKSALALNGYQQTSRVSGAALSLSFTPLRQKTASSFTLTKEGRVWDIRTRNLYALWKKMNSSHVSSCLTTASIESNAKRALPGSTASIFINGKKADSLSLSKNNLKTYRNQKGKITVVIENGQAWVSESSCDHKICLSLPRASLSGDRIICAPNRFLLEIKGSSFVDTIIG